MYNPKNVFRLVKSLYETGKNATTEQQNHLKKSGYNAICDIIPGHFFALLFGTVFPSVGRKKMQDKCVVFGCNNRPNKERGISIHPISFYRTVDTEKHRRRKK